MPGPKEFTQEFIEENSPEEEQLFTSFLKSGEPYRSFGRKDFHTAARSGYFHNPKWVPEGPTPGLDLADESVYYNTSGAAQDYWKDVDLPKPTKDITKLRADLREWGYCLIDEALSPEQYQNLRMRLEEQALAERKAGLACWMGTAPAPGDALPNVQFVHSLINKGKQFLQCVEHDPEGVQGGPVIEQLLNETLGEGFLMSSFISIIAHQNNMPQALHQDQAIAPHQDSVAPFTLNTMYIMDDMTAENGGTLVVPGSHKPISEAGSGKGVSEPLPPAINLVAPGGTVMMFEGRLLHGTGVNRTNKPRMMMVTNSVKSFMRQQELHMLSADVEVLKNASHKLLYRLGAFPTGLGGIEGAWNSEHLVGQRMALEKGAYKTIPALGPQDSEEKLGADYSYRHSEIGRRQAPHQPDVLASIKERYEDAGADFGAGSGSDWEPPKT